MKINLPQIFAEFFQIKFLRESAKIYPWKYAGKVLSTMFQLMRSADR